MHWATMRRVRAGRWAAVFLVLTWGACTTEEELPIKQLGSDAELVPIGSDAGPPGLQPTWPMTVAGATAASLVTDDEGMLVAGTFTKQVTLGGDVLDAASAATAGFIAKVDRRGEVLWANAATGAVTVSDLAVDADGFIYVAGRFAAATHCRTVGPEAPIERVDEVGSPPVRGTVCRLMAKATFGPWSVSARSHGLFVAKLDPAGKFVWVASARFDGPLPVAPKYNVPTMDRPGLHGGHIAVDSEGSIFLAGSVDGSATFGSITTTPDTRAIFVAKLDQAGRTRWLALAPDKGRRGANAVTAIAASPLGGALIAGTLANGASFGPLSRVQVPGDYQLTRRGSSGAGATDLFVARIDAHGLFRWARSGWVVGGSVGVADIVVDGAGSGFITGLAIAGSMPSPLPSPDPYPSTEPPAAPSPMILGDHRVERMGTAAFVSKIDKLGRFTWVARSSGAPAEPRGMTLDSEGDVLITGGVPNRTKASSVIFGTTVIMLEDGPMAFLARVNPSGELIWATAAHGASWGSAVVTDSQGDVFIAGRFGQPASFDGVTVRPVEGADIFIWKLAKP